MKNSKILKYISFAAATTGMVVPAIALSSCKTQDKQKDPETKTKLKQLNYSKAASKNDLVDANAPVTIANNSKYPFSMYIEFPKQANMLDPEEYIFQYRTSYSEGEAWSDWITIDMSSLSWETEFGGGAFIQLRVGVIKEANIGCFSEQDLPIRISLSQMKGPTTIEAGQGITIGGSILSLLCYVDTSVAYAYEWKGGSSELVTEWCFNGLFEYSNMITEVTPQFLPYKKLTAHCYQDMFKGCSNLVVPPSLPATDLAQECYATMFHECDRLTTAPYLPATTLATGCYNSMFEGCKSLNYVKLDYLGNFSSTYFNSWLGSVDTHGIIEYNGLDRTVGPDAIPSNFAVTYNQELIDEKTRTLTIQGDGESSQVTENNQIRFYKTDKFGDVKSQLDSIHSHIHDSELFVYWAKKNGNNFEQITGIDDLLISDSKIPDVIYPVYGFHPAIVKSSLNMITRAATTLKYTTKASGAKIYYKDLQAETPAWTELPDDDQGVIFDSKHQILLRGVTGSDSLTNYTNLNITGSVELDGSVMGILAGEDGAAHPTTVTPCCLYKLFAGSTGITKVSDNFLYYTDTNGEYQPITELNCIKNSQGTVTTPRYLCYASMFENCTKLTTTPLLPATSVGRGSYFNMFKGCTSLTSFGEIDATSCQEPYGDGTIYYGGFESMFENCRNLTTVAPTNGLKVTGGEMGMYHKMFRCSGLTKAPSMSLTKMADGANSASGKGVGSESSSNNGHYGVCSRMFESCTAMKYGPASIGTATTIGSYACYYMFANCTELEETPAWGSIATINQAGMEAMFYNCSKMTKCTSNFQSIGKTTIASYGLAQTFEKCSSLKNFPLFNLNTWIGDRDHTNMFYRTFKDCNAVRLYGSRSSSVSGYTTFIRIEPYGTVSRMAEFCNGMLDVTDHTAKDNCNTWNHDISDCENGTPDYSSLGKESKAYYYAFQTK